MLPGINENPDKVFCILILADKIECARFTADKAVKCMHGRRNPRGRQDDPVYIERHVKGGPHPGDRLQRPEGVDLPCRRVAQEDFRTVLGLDDGEIDRALRLAGRLLLKPRRKA
ncbi:MAG TPA: hypothetical protein DEA40_01260 [Parvularcula sp.]|nr:hypothetical protein [Parvularcula sp.]